MLLPTIQRLPLRFYTYVLFALAFGGVTYRCIVVGKPLLGACTVLAAGAAVMELMAMIKKAHLHVRTRAFVARK